MFKIKVNKLTDEAFRQFGSVISAEGNTPGGEPGIYEWYANQARVDNAESVSINLLTAVVREFVCRKFEAHARTTETVIPLTGGVIVAAIPAGEVRKERLEAFYIPVGMGVSFAPGVWHYAPYSIGRNATCAVIFREGTGADDARFEELNEDVGFTLT